MKKVAVSYVGVGDKILQTIAETFAAFVVTGMAISAGQRGLPQAILPMG